MSRLTPEVGLTSMSSYLRDDMSIVSHSKEAGILCVHGLVNRALSQCGAMNVSFHPFLTHFRPAELRQWRANTG